jgi:hypothetical protein
MTWTVSFVVAVDVAVAIAVQTYRAWSRGPGASWRICR